MRSVLEGKADLPVRPSGLLSYPTQTWEHRQSLRMRVYKHSVVRLFWHQFHARRRLYPGVVMACKIVAAIKKRDHIFLIKRFIAGFAKIGWNARKVEINSVALR